MPDPYSYLAPWSSSMRRSRSRMASVSSLFAASRRSASARISSAARSVAWSASSYLVAAGTENRAGTCPGEAVLRALPACPGPKTETLDYNVGVCHRENCAPRGAVLGRAI